MSKKTQDKVKMAEFTVKANKDIGQPILIVGDEAMFFLEEFQVMEPMMQLSIITDLARNLTGLRDQMMVAAIIAVVDAAGEDEEEGPDGALH